MYKKEERNRVMPETESRGGEIQEGSEQEQKIAQEQKQARRKKSEQSCQGEIEESGGRREVRTEKMESEMNPRDPTSKEKERV